MIFALMNFLRGYCLVRLQGKNQERFLYLCAKKNLLLWKLVKKDGNYEFYLSKAGYGYLEETAAKTGCDYRCLERRGLPFFFHRYRKRKILAATCLGCGICLYLLSLHVWKIEVEGSPAHSQEDILSYLKEKNIAWGIRASQVSCTALEKSIREDYEDIAWVSCELRGTVLRIHVKEVLEPGKKKDTSQTPCHLVAQKAGTIDSILVRSGTAAVKKGMKVSPGDVLISGIVDILNDAGETTESIAVKADGDIYAVTSVSYKDQLAYTYYKKKYTGKTGKDYKILLGDRLWNLYKGGRRFSVCEEETREIPLKLGSSFYLPMTLYEITSREYKAVRKTFSRKEAKKEARKRLSLFLQEYERKGVEILKNNVRIDCNENGCIAQGTITLKERFGKVKEITGDTHKKQKRSGS